MGNESLAAFASGFSSMSARRRRRQSAIHAAAAAVAPVCENLERRVLLSITATPVSITPTEGVPFTGTVATFTDSDPSPAADYTAKVDWGDGTVTAGVPVTGSGTFTVASSHPYAEDGSYPLTVTIAENNGADQDTATASGTASVAEGNFIFSSVGTINVTEGQPFSVPVATFQDPGSPDAPSDFLASITWGDGNTTAGTISGSAGNFTVSGTHTYLDEMSGTCEVTVTEPGANFTIGPIGSPVTVAEGDILGPELITTGTIAEHQSVGGEAAVFSDSGYPTNNPDDFTATFDWGDGTTYSTGAGNASLTSDGAGNITLSVAGHAYADEGTFIVHATLTDDSPGTASLTQTGTLTATESDSFTGGAAVTIAPTEMTSFSGAVATFTDTDTAGLASDFTANINWGDGTITAGMVSGSNGAFTVAGIHTYAEDGTYTTQASILDDAPGTASATVSGVANVGEGSLSITNAPVNATEGTAFSGVVATFQDAGSSDPASAYTASIDWGDGTTTVGNFSGAAGDYTISGTHTYADEGNFTAVVTAFESDDPGFTISVGDPVTVAEGDVLGPVLITTGTIAEHQSVGGEAAVFSDSGYPTNNPDDFTATFDWGDGTTYSTGAGNASLTSDGAGNITLSVAGHAYADEGTFIVHATLTDDSPGTASLTQTGTLTATESDSFTGGAAVTIAPTEMTSFSGAVATFTDTDTAGLASDFTANINWGDGTITAGMVSGSNGAFTVAGIHTYAEDGTYTTQASILDDAPGTASATVSGVANVAEGAFTVTPISGPTVKEGDASSVVLATISDPGSTDPATDYTATVDWGDGTTTVGTISGAAGTYMISGSHAYADEGTNTVSVVVSEPEGNFTSAPATFPINVTEGDTLVPSAPQNIFATEGGSSVLATFTDTGYPGNTASDFNATVDLGNGTTLAGIVSGGSGTFTVSVGGVDLEEGLYNNVKVTLADDAPGTASASVTETVFVADAPLTGTAKTFSAVGGITLNQAVVATFTDADPFGTVGDYISTINWGDGSPTSLGTVVANGVGGFNILGTHSYGTNGTFRPIVNFHDVAAGGFVTDTVAITPALSSSGKALSGSEGRQLSATVATFTASSSATQGQFSASINWGDGHVTSGTIVKDSAGHFHVNGVHAYAEESTGAGYLVTTTIHQTAGATTTASGRAKIAPAPLDSGAGRSLTAKVNTTFTNLTLGHFRDQDPLNTNAADYAGTIDWGDGTKSAVKFVFTGSTFNIGSFWNIEGSHKYGSKKTFTVKITLHDNASPTVNLLITASIKVT